MLSTLVIVALQHSRRVFWFSFDHWLRIPWLFSRGWTRLAFSFFLTQNFFFSPWAVIRDTFFSCSWPGIFLFFSVPWILVDIRLVYIYIYIYIRVYSLSEWFLPIFTSVVLSFKNYFTIFTIFLSKCLGFSFSIFTNTSAWAGYDTRSIFKRSLTGLNSEFSYS